MIDRVFSETDLRSMIHMATGFRLSMIRGRYEIDTKLDSEPWIVVIEPDWDQRVLVVITAYRRQRR